MAEKEVERQHDTTRLEVSQIELRIYW